MYTNHSPLPYLPLYTLLVPQTFAYVVLKKNDIITSDMPNCFFCLDLNWVKWNNARPCRCSMITPKEKRDYRNEWTEGLPSNKRSPLGPPFQ